MHLSVYVSGNFFPHLIGHMVKTSCLYRVDYNNLYQLIGEKVPKKVPNTVYACIPT